MVKARISHAKIIVMLCILYVLVSPLNTVLPISLNRVITLLFIALELFYAFIEGVSSRWVFYVLFWGSIGLFACIRGPVLSENISDMVYIFTSFFLLQITYKIKLLEKIAEIFRAQYRVIMLCMIITYLIIGVSALSGAAYESNGAFRGFMYNSHAMATTAILASCITELCEVVDTNRKKKIINIYTILIAIGLIVVLASKSRTFLIPEAVLIWKYLLRLPIKKTQVVPVAIVIFLFVVFMLRDYILEKFLEAMSNQYAANNMAAFTNFRSVLWECDIKQFINENVFLKLLGNGFSFVRELHEKELHTRLWSHNDLTYLLLASGVTGLFIYLKEIYYAAKAFCTKKSYIIYFIAFVVFPMCVNGFYIYTSLIWAFMIFRLMLYVEGSNYKIKAQAV